MDFTRLIDLASPRLGGRVLSANDEFFAPKANLIKPAAAVWREGAYTSRGKWMDGWETRRRRTPGHDWAVIRLGPRGVVRGLNIDTAFFTGNFPSHASVEAAGAGGPWVELLPKSELKGGGDNLFPVSRPEPFERVRLNIFPDGGVARLRVYGEVVPDWGRAKRGALVDLAAAENGGLPLDSSDHYFSHPLNLIMPGRARNMGDGWETKRRRGPGHDWVVLRLGAPGRIEKAEVDTNHFKGNYPDSCELEASSGPGAPWRPLLPRSKLKAHRRHFFSKELLPHEPAALVRLSIHPDGGVSRLRLWGRRA